MVKTDKPINDLQESIESHSLLCFFVDTLVLFFIDKVLLSVISSHFSVD